MSANVELRSGIGQVPASGLRLSLHLVRHPAICENTLNMLEIGEIVNPIIA